MRRAAALIGAAVAALLALISPLVKPPGEYGSLTYVYSMLRTLQDGFGVVAPGYLGAANQVSPLPASWN
jgi:hypothetical protein